jgi:hypothetical protein
MYSKVAPFQMFAPNMDCPLNLGTRGQLLNRKRSDGYGKSTYANKFLRNMMMDPACEEDPDTKIVHRVVDEGQGILLEYINRLKSFYFAVYK